MVLGSSTITGLIADANTAWSLQLTTAEKRTWVGDSPAETLPVAHDLSPKLTKNSVVHAIDKVADWQLARAEPGFDQDWTFATLYDGFMSIPDQAQGGRYRTAMLAMGKKFQWELGPRIAHADDHAIGQTYLDLYTRLKDPAIIAPTVVRIDTVMRLPDDPDKDERAGRLTINFKVDVDIALRFVAKVALSAGYFAYGDMFRNQVKHCDFRAIMNSHPPSTAGLENVEGRVDDRFNDNINENGRIFRALCKDAEPHSIVALIPGTDSFAVFVGLLGGLRGNDQCSCESERLP